MKNIATNNISLPPSTTSASLTTAIVSGYATYWLVPLPMTAYLESSNELNNPLYERYGFEIVGEEDLPDGGPTIWFMQREARRKL